MEEEFSAEKLSKLLGKKVEVIAFNIAYQGILESYNLDLGTLKLVDQDDSVTLTLERIESLIEVQC